MSVNREDIRIPLQKSVTMVRLRILLLVTLVTVLLLAVLGHTASVQLSSRLENRESASKNSIGAKDLSARCSSLLDCTHEKPQPVCGSDGKLYNNACEIHRLNCEGHRISIRHRSKCSLAGIGLMTKRRKTARQRPDIQGCTQADRTLFNKNLVKLFVEEYSRVPDTDRQESQSVEKRAIDWKFTDLDKNLNSFLDQTEIRSLRKMVKKFVKPRDCAKRFTKFCDEDRNRKIGRSEWINCLSDVVSNEENDPVRTHDDGGGYEEDSSPAAAWNQQLNQLTADEKASDSADDDVPDCPTDRRNALEQLRNTQSAVYVPDCTPEGKFTQVQCYSNTDYCWCVDQDTGKPIQTTVRNGKPDCDKLLKAERSISGCPENTKRRFFTDFIDYLSKEMLVSNHSVSPMSDQNSGSLSVLGLPSNVSLPLLPPTSLSSSTAEHPVDKLAKWKFSLLDKDSNRVLDRKEWREFRKELKKKKTIRKCGRNFIRFCDGNSDRKITYDEWMDCFSVLKERKNSIPRRRQKGQNPLDKYLKTD